jgi:hypothetical protein
MTHTLARMLFSQPVGPREMSRERHQGLARLRALLLAVAIVTDLAIWAVLARDPHIDGAVLRGFLAINLPLLALDVGVALALSRWAPGRWFVPALVASIPVEIFTAMVWVQVSGSVSAYSIALPMILIAFYRIAYDLRLSLVAFASALAMHGAIVLLELLQVLRPESMFVGPMSRMYGSPGFVLGSFLSIAGVYTFALLVPNYVMNRLHLKDLQLAVAFDQARHGRHSGRFLAGRYRLGEVIGRGGMGEVYQARDEHGRRDCAVKVLHPHLVSERGPLRRFEREAEVVGRLGSPHIVEVFETGVTDDGLPFIALELLRGEDLDQRLRRTGLMTPRELAPLCEQVAAALGVAHAAGIVHRDLKPQNIFLAGAPEAPLVKVLDFGVCKVRDDGDGLTHTADLIGTPGYMAPEQIAGDARAVDARTDVFALGAVLYRALTGLLPFGGGDLTRVLYRIVHEPPVLPSRLKAQVSADLDAVLLLALAKTPAQRYATVAELARDFAAAAAGTLDETARSRATPLVELADRASAAEPGDPLAPTLELREESGALPPGGVVP